MLRFPALVVIAAFCFLSSALNAQAPGTGRYPFSSFDNLGFDSINVGNLNTHFEIPIVSKQGRGQNFVYSLVYDGLVWSPSPVGATQKWVPDPTWGFRGQLNGQSADGVVGYIRTTDQLVKCFDDPNNPGTPSYLLKMSNFIYFDAFGQQHPIDYSYNFCTNTATGDGTTSDGSGYSFDGLSVHNRYGVTLNVPYNDDPDFGSSTDTNGNVISNNGDGTFTDTLGTVPLTITGGGTAGSPHILTYKVANQADGSTTSSVTVSYVHYTIQTTFSCPDIGDIGADGNQQYDLVDRITLADGTFYQFAYEATQGGLAGAVTGRLASITLPTGGTITYSYSGGCNGHGTNSDGTPGILSRGADGTRTYTRAVNANSTSTTVQDEAGNQSFYQFIIADGQFYETHRQAYQGAIGGTPLLDRTTCYNGQETNCDGASITLPVSQTNRTVHKNGVGGLLEKALYLSNGLLDQQQLWNVSGLWYGTTYYEYNALGRVTRVHAVDTSGAKVSDINYGYDEQTATTTSGIPHHTTGTGAPGNQTSAHAWINTGGTLDTSTVYYDTGVPVSSSDPNGTTQYTYDSTQGFATQTTPPTPSSGVSLPTTASYDAASGVQLSASDANNTSPPQYQYTQYDKLLRVQHMSTADGGGTTYEYHPTPNAYWGGLYVREHSTVGGGNSDTYTDRLFDRNGRIRRVGIYNGLSTASNDWYQVDYCYDAVGNLHYVSLPYQSSGMDAPASCSGSGTTYTYDALGRVTNTSSPDGNTWYYYNGGAVRITDVTGQQKITQTDALGRTTAICEVLADDLPNDPRQSCGLDISGTGYLTTYTYDLANHKTTVTQGVQQRIFQTDSLDRMIYTSEPESGETSYSYLYNATGLKITRTRPLANQSNPNVKTHTFTQYDKLGRVVSVSYEDGTPAKTYQYDQATAWGEPGTVGLGASKGRLTEVITNPPTNWISGAFFIYDSMGRVTATAQCLPSGCGNAGLDKSLYYSYDLVGNMTSATDGAGVTTTYHYTPASEVSSITSSVSDPTHPASLVSGVQSGPFGPGNWVLGNGLTGVAGYDSMGRKTEVAVCNNGSTSTDCGGVAGASLFHSSSGFQSTHILWRCDSVLSRCDNFTYDGLARLKTMESSGTNQYTYTYDRYGNRLQQSANPNVGGVSASYHAKLANNQVDEPGFQYDAAGNMTYDNVFHHKYTYDAEGNVTQVDDGVTATYYYNAFNQRVRADAALGVPRQIVSREYVYSVSGQRVSVWDGNTHAQVRGQYYWGSKPIAFYSGNSLHFQHQDWLGTERMRTSYIAAVEGRYQSLPFGDGFSASGTDDDPYHFAELDRDSETDTQHGQFRQYSSTQGRWMSPDPYMGSYDFSDPQSFNRYSYVMNRPLTDTDPSGLDPNCLDGESNNIGCTGSEPVYGGGYAAGDSIFPITPIIPGDPSRHGEPYKPPSCGVFCPGDNFGGLTANPWGFMLGTRFGGSSGRSTAPSSAFTLKHIAACSASAAILGVAQLTNRVTGAGIGGSAGIGSSGMGLYGSLGLQVVADPQGNVGLALNGSFSFVGFGIGALGGGQLSLSTARNINGLSGPAFDPSGSYGPAGLDVAFSPDGTKTGTLTFGPGIGEKISGAAGASGTGILTSTNCKDMFPK